jgi:ADP-ribosylglycohydrolase
MRVSPVGWAFDTLEATLAAAKQSAEVTHNHPEGIKGAQATAACVFLARQGSIESGDEGIYREVLSDMTFIGHVMKYGLIMTSI